MAICEACRIIPFSDLPPPPSTFNGVSSVNNDNELLITWSEDYQGAGFPWHDSLDVLAESAKKSRCPICSVVQVAVGDWIAHYNANQETEKLENEISVFDKAPRDAKLWITRRYNGGLGFIVAGRHLSSKARSTNIFAAIAFSFDADDTSPQGLLLPATDADSGSFESLNVAGRWIAECVDEHHECDKRVGPLPTRVLDVGFSDDMVKLIKTSAHDSGSYVALSYCWGNSLLNLTTTGASLEARFAGIRLSEMPKTFQDAVTIARHLQIRYLWIDSLCIIQDDQDDWAREASRMKDVYSGAHLVIAADRSRDCTEGCFHVRDQLPSVVVKIPGTGIVRAKMLCPSDELASHGRMFNSDPLSQRTWALQERILARRVLHYTRKQMYFECNEALLSESGCRIEGRFADLHKLHRAGSSVEDALSSWEYLVGAISNRKLTNAADKLPAMAGLASMIGPLVGGEYVAGLWSNALVKGLEWWSRPGSRSGGSGPSWSWAGHEGPVSYFPRKTVSAVKVESWSVELANNQNVFGRVQEAWVRLSGPVVRLQITGSSARISNRDPSLLAPHVRTPYSKQDKIARLDHIEIMRSGQWRNWDLHLLGLTKRDQGANKERGLGLVLAHIGDENGTQMSRVGWMSLDEELESGMLADDTCYKTITLV
ncbi:unnamed protein product [Clonostachys rosea]|uniref:Heterokaryon incompatibility domain-containing protein n=1 Tax=Bionectria ochroleuca TaxID=29856 RepID=A0ABY6UNU2_BIOOC|nr:unnamed protein product [Clonostachys rosea]